MYYLGKLESNKFKTIYIIYTKDTLATKFSNSIENAYFNYKNDNFNINESTINWKFDPTMYECILEFESLETFKDDYPEYFI